MIIKELSVKMPDDGKVHVCMCNYSGDHFHDITKMVADIDPLLYCILYMIFNRDTHILPRGLKSNERDIA